MSGTSVLRVAVTAGDPAGIGPEVRAAALERLGAVEGVEWVLVGGADPTLPRGPSAASGRAAARDLERAARLALDGEVDAVCTGPVSKKALSLAGLPHRGQTDYLAALSGTERVLMTFVGGELVVALATRHVPLSEVARHLSVEGIVADLELLSEGLRLDLGRPRARVLVTGLNPHAGEEGLLGREEEEILRPALALARSRGIDAVGPLPADSAFPRALRGEADAVLAMYHDQGLAPFKLHAFGRGVNVTLGLPFVRTSPDHGTAYDRVGTGEADPASMLCALETAVRCVRARRGG